MTHLDPDPLRAPGTDDQYPTLARVEPGWILVVAVLALVMGVAIGRAL